MSQPLMSSHRHPPAVFGRLDAGRGGGRGRRRHFGVRRRSGPASKSPNEKLGVACVGVRGQGNEPSRKSSVAAPTPKCCTSCDVDENVGRRKAAGQGKLAARTRAGSFIRTKVRAPTCASCSKTRRSTSSPPPRPTTGTRWSRSGPCRPARTCTSKSRSATTSAKAAAWSRPPASTTASARPARNAAR